LEVVALRLGSVAAVAAAIAAVALAPAAAAQAPEPVVTLTLRASGTGAGEGPRIAIAGTFRGRAIAGRRTYELRPVGVVVATHRHGRAAAQRARVERLYLDARSGPGFLRVVVRASLIGGPAIAGPRGACERVALRHVVRPGGGVAILRWACRPAVADRGPAVHRDAVRRPRDTIASTYTIVTRPCTPAPAPARGAQAAPGTAPC
jgi:hypothetical protein